MTVTINDLRQHLRLDLDDTTEDAFLAELIEAATLSARRYASEIPDPMPADVRVAVRQIAAGLYEDREGSSDPLEGSRRLLDPYREWAF